MTTINVLRKQSSRVHPGLKLQFDYWLLLTLAGLIVLGLLLVYSSTFDYGVRFYDDATYYFRRQFIALLIGLAAIIVIMQFDYHILRRFSVPMMGLTIIGLLIVLLLGESIFGAKRGLIAGSYQPSEAAKLAMILYISHWVSSKGERIKNLTYGLIPFSLITGFVCGLVVLQPDLSTAALIALVSITLFFIAGADWRQFAITGVLAAAAFAGLVTTLGHASQRLQDYLIGLKDPFQASWNVQQALASLGRGGWSGVGLGQSTQKFGALPFAHTDGVFAILAEEMGLAGSFLLLGLMALLVWRGVYTARQARDNYGSLLALGITCWLAYQALINMAVITAVVPFTGIPLPFLSYGGSSLLVSMIGAGILLNISRDAAINKRVQPKRSSQSET